MIPHVLFILHIVLSTLATSILCYSNMPGMVLCQNFCFLFFLLGMLPTTYMPQFCRFSFSLSLYLKLAFSVRSFLATQLYFILLTKIFYMLFFVGLHQWVPWRQRFCLLIFVTPRPKTVAGTWKLPYKYLANEYKQKAVHTEEER